MDSERLLHSCRDDWKRSLLQAAASEVAPEGVQTQVLDALETLGSALHPPPECDPLEYHPPAPSAAPPALGTQLARLEGGVATKLALALLIAAGAPAAYWLATRDTDPARVASEPAAPTPAASPTLPELPLPMPQAMPLPTPLPVPTPPPDALAASPARVPLPVPRPLPRSTSASRPRPKPLAPMTADPLSAELRLLTAARSQLQSGSAPAALETLERYRRTFPQGVLEPEAEALELRAREAALRGR